MNKKTKLAIAAGAVAAVTAGVGGGIAIASGGADYEQPVPAPALTRASEAALAATGGGRVTGTEIGDEESLYEIEVTLPDGRQVDVQLDANFAVVGSKTDQEDGTG